MDGKLGCSVGIMAYNEAANIAHAITSILEQPAIHAEVTELIVVASGCTDNTVPIVSAIAGQDPRVHLLVQERREGKASAINLFLAGAKAPILVMVSADVLLKPGTLDALIKPLRDPTVGMVGAHPIPVNNERSFLGHTVHLLWNLHDHVARQSPKLGEVVAFRNVVPSIPRDTPVDEISIQGLISQFGYHLVYEPRAIVYNRGPETIGDFLRQRRRIYRGHLQIRAQQGYAASTMSMARIGRALLAERPFASLRATCWTVGAVGLEALARGLGTYDHMRRRPHHLWQTAPTTKAHIAEAASLPGSQSVLVFHITQFHLYELEYGVRTSQMLVDNVSQVMRQALPRGGIVAPERNGTIIAILPADRDEAQGAAQRIIQTVEVARVQLSGRRDSISVRLACGIIAFTQTGHAQVFSVPAPA